ncbi:MAG: hypothetical protein NUV96_02910 [Candidatus Colwellbacteria bacterium]|nr:hypothetical protein [Candidatus Colwellbacteria bacterium]
MLGSIIVAVITVSLLFTGVYIGNVQNADKAATDQAQSYDEGFFGSIDALVGGLGESAERGEETREDRYQEYLQVQERAVEANTNLQSSSPSVPSTYFAKPSTTDTISQTSSAAQEESQSTTQGTADKKTSSEDSATAKSTTTSTAATSTTSLGVSAQQGSQSNTNQTTSSGDSAIDNTTTTSATTISVTPAPSVPSVDDFSVEDLDDFFSDFDDDLGIDF